MDLSRIGLGKQIAGGGAIALIISLFLPWYGIDISGFSADGSGWEVMDFADILLFLAGAITIALIVGELMNKLPDLPLPPLQIMQALGGTAVLIVLLRLIDVPDGADRKFGIFLALIAAAAMAYGSYRAASDSTRTY